MGSIAHYRGNVVDDLVEMHEAGHLFGPDRCGDTHWSYTDVRNALTIGPAGVAREYVTEGANGRGAHYTLAEATYNPDTNITTAQFKPYIPPHQNVRYYGGDQQDIVPTHTLADKDTIRGR
jgi:hypothetical protein